MWETTLDAFFPRRCFVCDRVLEPWEYEEGLHKACREKVFPVVGHQCMHCGAPIKKGQEYCMNCARERNFAFRQGKTLFMYKGAIKHSMYRFKYGGKAEYAKAFARIAFALHGDWLLSRGITDLVAVPMYKKKQKARGYNQAQELAKALAIEWEAQTGQSIPIDNTTVVRSKNTAPMKNLNKSERYQNLKNAFQKGNDVVSYGKIALVVDDIYTTGATIDAVASVLKDAGYEDIFFLSICMGRGSMGG